ncbi:hypothetical protein T4D_6131 [Trichinella pseudospiralis]|uniref:Uncharacterized protein n=1 Tax=Trichinella pseudospiralis TaxID=6337 RepID=A0A0V1G1H0_TRIPS|nr:hypothetical protein T4D_6131 [Trichinella pseudospiralis]
MVKGLRHKQRIMIQSSPVYFPDSFLHVASSSSKQHDGSASAHIAIALSRRSSRTVALMKRSPGFQGVPFSQTYARVFVILISFGHWALVPQYQSD